MEGYGVLTQVKGNW